MAAAPPTSTAFGLRVAGAAKAKAPCDAHKVNVDGYTTVNVRPADRTALGRAYFFATPGPSTCGLWACGAMRIGGLDDAAKDPELNKPYVIGDAVSDVQTVAQRYGILEWGAPADPFLTGDVVIVDDGSGSDAHVIVCTSDAVVNADGSWTVDTSEGGQFSGVDSTASGLFVRTFTLQNGQRYCGSRFVIRTARCSGLEVADPNPKPLPAPPATTTPPSSSTTPTTPAPPATSPSSASSSASGAATGTAKTPAAPPDPLDEVFARVWRYVRAGLATATAGVLGYARKSVDFIEAHPVAFVLAVVVVIVLLVAFEEWRRARTKRSSAIAVAA